jgi:hypothetical protein
MELLKKLVELESYIPRRDQRNDKITASTIGWQMDHTLQVVSGIVGALDQSDPKDYTPKFSTKWLFIKTTGYIPRGVGKAPKYVVSKQDLFEKVYLEDLLTKARRAVAQIESIDENAFFKHPYFGNLNKRNAVQFVTIHTEHHLKIIRDILKS